MFYKPQHTRVYLAFPNHSASRALNPTSLYSVVTPNKFIYDLLVCKSSNKAKASSIFDDISVSKITFNGCISLIKDNHC